MAGFGSSTLSIASVLAAQAYVEARPVPAAREVPAAPKPAPLAEAPSTAPSAPSPTNGTIQPVGDARRVRHWSVLGAARRAVR